MTGDGFKFVQEDTHTELCYTPFCYHKQAKVLETFLGDEQTSNSLLYKETLLSAVLGFGRNWIKICLDILLKH